jgi:hypothetical protein
MIASSNPSAGAFGRRADPLARRGFSCSASSTDCMSWTTGHDPAECSNSSSSSNVACRVHLVCRVYLVHLVSFVQPKNQTDQTDQTNKTDAHVAPADLFSILLEQRS